MVENFANKLRCYKKKVRIQDIRERLVLSRKKGHVDPGSTLTKQCGPSSPVISKRPYTEAMYHCPITVDK